MAIATTSTEVRDRVADAEPSAWLKPLYPGARGAWVLQAIETLAWAWTQGGFWVVTSGGNTLELSVSGGSQVSRFEIRAAPASESSGAASGGRRGRPPSHAPLEFRLDPDREGRAREAGPARVFKAMDATTIHALTVLLLTTWERRHRDWLAWRRRDWVEARARALQAVEEAQRRERERIEAARRALRQRRMRLLLRAAQGVRRAGEIRGLVAELAWSAAVQESCGEGFAQWSTWALGQADALDLSAQPVPAVAQWLAAFELEAENDSE